MTFGILTLIPIVVLPVYVAFNMANRDVKEFHHLEFIFMSLLGLILAGLIVVLISIPFFGNNAYPFYFSPFTLTYKKVYHSDLGVFYMETSHSGSRYKPGDIKITVYAQHLFYSKELFEIEHDGNMDKSIQKIKDKLESIHKDILEVKRKLKTIEGWDGHFDKQSRRDHNLSESNEALENNFKSVPLLKQIIKLCKQSSSHESEAQKHEDDLYKTEREIELRKKIHKWMDQQDSNANMQDVLK